MKKLKSFIQAFKNIGKIKEGITNTIFKKQTVEVIAKMRMDICNNCKLIDYEGSECFAANTQPCCSACGCSLKFKTRSLSSECPQGYWDALMTEEQEEKLNEKNGTN